MHDFSPNYEMGLRKLQMLIILINHFIKLERNWLLAPWRLSFTPYCNFEVSVRLSPIFQGRMRLPNIPYATLVADLIQARGKPSYSESAIESW